jgi:hypothetical protein
MSGRPIKPKDFSIAGSAQMLIFYCTEKRLLRQTDWQLHPGGIATRCHPIILLILKSIKNKPNPKTVFFEDIADWYDNC